jgi:hypothetical protein
VVVEVEELRQVLGCTSRVTRIRESSVRVSQLIKEGVDHSLDSGQTLCRCVFEKLRNEIDGAGIGLAEDLFGSVSKDSECDQRDITYLVEGMRLDLRELVLHVVGVHGADLVASRGSQDLDDLDQLIDTRLAREQRLTKHELSHNTTSGPDI